MKIKDLKNQTLKRTNILVMAFACTMLMVPGMKTQAADTLLSGDCGKNAKFVVDSDYVLTISGTGATDDYDMDTDDWDIEWDGDVHDIYVNPYPWVDYREQIKKVVIEDGITVIGNEIFDLMENVNEVEIPDSVRIIKKGSFSHCKSIKEIVLPETLSSIGYGAFYCCYGLEQINLPDSLAEIGEYAFCYCDSLKRVEWPQNAREIKSSTFGYCKSLEEVILPETLTTIRIGAFSQCVKLKNLVIPDSVTEIENWVFPGAGLETVKLPNGIKRIENQTFKSTNLKSIIIPESVEYLGIEAFAYCKELVDVSMSETLFQNTNLAKVFKDTPYLSKISKEQNSGTIKNMNWTLDDQGVLTLDCNGGSCVSFKNTILYARKEEIKEVVILNAKDIVAQCFEKMPNITKVSIEEGLELIGYEAFYYATSLEEIELPKSLQSIGGFAFSHTALKEVTIPSKVEYIQRGAFDAAKELEKVVIEEGCTYIYEYAFAYCTNLKEISLPQSLEGVESKAFSTCNKLKSLEFPAGITIIAIDAFEKCKDLETVKMPCKFRNNSFKHGEKTKITFYHDDQEAFVWNKELSDCSFAKKCSTCGRTTKEKECKVSREITKKASLKKDGKITITATYGKKSDKKEIVIPRIQDVNLEYDKTAYSGQPKQPTVTVTDADGKKINNKYYNVTYAKNKNIGKATVTVKFKENYMGTVEKKFLINPKKTIIMGITPKATKLTVNWNKQAVKTTGYEVQIATDKKFTKDVKTITTKKNTTLSCKFTKLKRGTKYYVRIRTYKAYDQNTYYSLWYEYPKAVKTNK